MGRPRLHKTPQEKAEAARRYRKKYYDRNRDIISSNHKAKYRARQRANVVSQAVPVEGPTSMSESHSRRRHSHCDSTDVQDRSKGHAIVISRTSGSRRKNSMVEAEATLSRLTNGSSTELLDHLILHFSDTEAVEPCIQSIKTLLDNVDKLREDVQERHRATLQCYGVGGELRQVELTAGRVASFTKVLEDILMHAMADPHNLLSHHTRGELLYQITPDITAL